jgi:protein-tyrosine-phosphatase
MVAATANCGLENRTTQYLAAHKSALLTREEVADPGTVLFLVTSQHEDWMRQTVGSGAVDAARSEGRLQMIHSQGRDIPDPFFGDADTYNEVCGIIKEETLSTLVASLRVRGVLPRNGTGGDPAAL